MPEDQPGLNHAGQDTHPGTGHGLLRAESGGVRGRGDASFALPPTPQESLARSLWRANRIALDAPHWFGLSQPGDEEELEMPQRYGLQPDGRGWNAHVPAPGAATVVEAAAAGVLSFPASGAGADAEANRVPRPRGWHGALPAGVLPFCAPAGRRAIGIFSMVGGVGGTSLAASLARVLASCGERVLLADTAGHSLLPHYFGGKGSRQGSVRRFLPKLGPTNQPIRLVSLDVQSFAGNEEEQERILTDFNHEAARVDRVVWDLGSAPSEWVRRVLQQGMRVVVPLLPAAQCLMQLAATEQLLQQCQKQGNAARWQYVVNQYDERDDAHVAIRGRFRAQLGDRLLPFILRSSPLVNEALLYGRTVVDHAPASPLVQDLWRFSRSIAGLPQPYPAFEPESWQEA